jgi:hypothetical protein
VVVGEDAARGEGVLGEGAGALVELTPLGGPGLP